MMFRFDKTATLYKKIISNDDEELRSAVKGVEFRCFATGKTKSQAPITDGVLASNIAITLQTDDEIALTIEADDSIIYDSYEYSVKDVSSIRSAAFKDAKEYLIRLQ